MASGSNLTSTGRGGAGNIADASKSPQVQPSDLETPHLKTPMVTTGRGGSGNMTPNRDPDETRARQDVGPIDRPASTGPTHVGRGGAANVSTPNEPQHVGKDAAAVHEGQLHGSEDNSNNSNNDTSNTNAGSNSGSSDKKTKAEVLADKAKCLFKKA
ncbi:hypothetical protein GGR56DRAFT_670799 [Xylariaceae sp. FL0804]|nr:hypothetical protein GGR56DRAFT_670799 [Xylariaceae sp. FL0804]